MLDSFIILAAEIRAWIHQAVSERVEFHTLTPSSDSMFQRLALRLFALQAKHVPVVAAVCQARGLSPMAISDWQSIPPISTTAFRYAEATSIPETERCACFCSSGTTTADRSRHFHHASSLELYEASLWAAFQHHVMAGDNESRILTGRNLCCRRARMVFLAPSAAEAPQSSLVYMLASIARSVGAVADTVFAGSVDSGGLWQINPARITELLTKVADQGEPVIVFGTAFSLLHWLDDCTARKVNLRLPRGSVILETGGYKGRSREIARDELHALICQHTGVPQTHIVREYGMCELSSQAYDRKAGADSSGFYFPPWTRVRIVSPENGQLVGEGEKGVIQVFDLANVWSIMAVQTGDLGVRRGAGFELIGRNTRTIPKGCSLFAGTF